MPAVNRSSVADPLRAIGAAGEFHLAIFRHQHGEILLAESPKNREMLVAVGLHVIQFQPLVDDVFAFVRAQLPYFRRRIAFPLGSATDYWFAETRCSTAGINASA